LLSDPPPAYAAGGYVDGQYKDAPQAPVPPTAMPPYPGVCNAQYCGCLHTVTVGL